MKFTYCRVVTAESAQGAYAKVCRLIKDEPGSIVTRVEQGAWGKKKRGVLSQLLFG